VSPNHRRKLVNLPNVERINNICSAIHELRDVFDDMESKVLQNEESMKRILMLLNKQEEASVNDFSDNSDTRSVGSNQKDRRNSHISETDSEDDSTHENKSIEFKSCETTDKSGTKSDTNKRRFYGLG
jgi:hypothetical protein